MADVHKTNIINIFFRTLILIIIFSLHIFHFSFLITHFSFLITHFSFLISP